MHAKVIFLVINYVLLLIIAFTGSIDENTLDQSTIATVSATDAADGTNADGITGQNSYSLVQATDLFHLDPDTGVVTNLVRLAYVYI